MAKDVNVFLGAANRRRKGAKNADRFKVDSDSGKIVIPAEGSDSDDEVDAKEGAGGAYKESLTSVDGFTRDGRGRVKFNKDTKKRRRENEDEDGDVEMGDETATSNKKNRRRSEVKLGREFKAKVRLLFLCWSFLTVDTESGR